MKNLKVNLHITEKCNYSCRYCFAHFGKHCDLPAESWKHIIRNIKSSGIISDINFAGGEPVLHRGFYELVDYAKDLGFNVSLITNGSLLLNRQIVKEGLFEKLTTLGISADSFNTATLVSLGCCDNQYNVLKLDDLDALVSKAKKENEKIRIKLNTVVSKLNVNETITQIEDRISVDRWKFLKMKAFKNDHFSNFDLLISDEEFKEFLLRNQVKKGEAVPEQSLTRSYIMVDNRGNLVDDEGDDYSVVGNLLNEDFCDVFRRYHFNTELYHSRYKEADAG